MLSLAGSRLILCLFLAAVSGNPEAVTSDWEIDSTGTVHDVVDGDTFKAFPVGRVRLADIDAPESGEPGAREAREYLASLANHRSVHLDVDDLFGADSYGRIVAVAYIRHNSTHLLNLNKAMLESGLAVLSNFVNEFDPAGWTLYVDHPADLPPSSALFVGVGTTAIAFVLILIRSRLRMASG